MLGFKGHITLGEGIRQPIYKGMYDNGFIAQFEFKTKNARALRVLWEAAEEGLSYEEVLNKLFGVRGNQPWMARTIFRAFRVAAIILSVVIITKAV
jgi:hypothetical protein